VKIFRQECISIPLICCLALQSTLSFGQEKTAKSAPDQIVQQVAAQEISKEIVIDRFKQLGLESRDMRLLDSKLRNLKFSPATAPEHYWGKTSTYQRIIEGRPEHLIVAMYVRDYVKQNSKDAAGLAQLTLTSSSGLAKTYSFYLIAPGADFKQVQEYAVTSDIVTLQHSWWTCFKCQLVSVGVQCAEALATCAPSAETVVGYLGCVGLACGEAAVGASACCLCNGDWWCSWAVGSCSQSQQCNQTGNGGHGVVVPPACERCCEYDPKKGHCIQCVSGRQQCP